MPGNGSLVAAVRAGVDAEPLIAGKPHPLLLEVAAKRAETPVDELIVVGDRPDSDVLMANRVGARSALILTGVTTAVQIPNLPNEHRPTWVFPDLGEEFREFFHLGSEQ